MTTTTLRRPKCSIISRLIFIFPCPLQAIAFKSVLFRVILFEWNDGAVKKQEINISYGRGLGKIFNSPAFSLSYGTAIILFKSIYWTMLNGRESWKLLKLSLVSMPNFISFFPYMQTESDVIFQTGQIYLISRQKGSSLYIHICSIHIFNQLHKGRNEKVSL